MLWHDFRYGWRMLRQSPTFAALTILTLAVGIAANTTVFSWIHAVVGRQNAIREILAVNPLVLW